MKYVKSNNDLCLLICSSIFISGKGGIGFVKEMANVGREESGVKSISFGWQLFLSGPWSCKIRCPPQCLKLVLDPINKPPTIVGGLFMGSNASSEYVLIVGHFCFRFLNINCSFCFVFVLEEVVLKFVLAELTL